VNHPKRKMKLMRTRDREGSQGEACPTSKPACWPEEMVQENPQASYYRARYYDPNGGRFVSEDPARFTASVNFYGYVDGDPVDWTDPAGLDKGHVCCRPLRKARPFLRIWHHCYIKIIDANGNPTTWGVLPNKQGVQVPQEGGANSGGKCKDIGCGTCQDSGSLDKLRRYLNNAVDSGTCPSCGSLYHNWWWVFDGNNSNTFVYSAMVFAGLCPPPEPRSPGYHYYTPVPMR